jgi:dihydroorotate dehydrogenase
MHANFVSKFYCLDAASGREKIEAGAKLLQVYTGFIFRGPKLIREIASL